jgi:hypothetical protein
VQRIDHRNAGREVETGLVAAPAEAVEQRDLVVALSPRPTSQSSVRSMASSDIGIAELAISLNLPPRNRAAMVA